MAKSKVKQAVKKSFVPLLKPVSPEINGVVHPRRLVQGRSLRSACLTQRWPPSCSSSLWSHQIETVTTMARGNERKSERDGGRAEPSLSERVVDRRLDLPRSFRDKSIHDVWGPNGPAALLRRLAQENELGRLAPRQLTKDELAQLVELYEDEPLPKALRNLVVLELRNQRRARPGPKTDLNSIQRLEQDLLPSVYRRAMRAAVWLRKRLIRREERKMRWQTKEPVPSQTELAMDFVRSRLPSTRDLDDKTIANRLSAIKDPSEKKPRAKAAKR